MKNHNLWIIIVWLQTCNIIRIDELQLRDYKNIDLWQWFPNFSTLVPLKKFCSDFAPPTIYALFKDKECEFMIQFH